MDNCFPYGYAIDPSSSGIYASHSSSACGSGGNAALMIYDALASTSPAGPADLHAVSVPVTEAQVYALYYADRRTPSDVHLQSVATLAGTPGELRGAALEVLVAMRERRGQREAALALARSLEQFYPGRIRAVRARLFKARLLAATRPADAAVALAQAEAVLNRLEGLERWQAQTEFVSVREIVEAETAGAALSTSRAASQSPGASSFSGRAAFEAGVYPNPSRGITTLRYAVAKTARVRAEVFDVTGRRVALLVDEVQASGPHTVPFDASGLPPGIFLWRITVGANERSGTVTMLR